ncbi:MAG: biosynthetic peptidoglycan transglycosylase, partial [Pseudomonadota bacterium]|nr:biosynthetic peptidoglycan transglycosylase [Pseudomonadota bacterium]
MKRQSIWITLSLIMTIGLTFLLWKTQTSLLSPPKTLTITDTAVQKAQILDRHGLPLTITYQNNWNIHDQVPLHAIPEQLQNVFIIAEDKRFFEHPGLDWQARIHAMLQNILALRIVRGASTITEQSVRMIHVRPRIFWSRWLEGFEAARFEAQFSKADILEFYLNQVPYASRRRGVVQAARYYFARSLDTLNLKEMMALAVLVRAPSRLDLWQSTTAIEPSIQRLAQRLR